MSLWIIRILFMVLCMLGGIAVSQVQPELINRWYLGAIIGFGFGGLMVAIDEMVKGFSLRAFSAATFGLFLGTIAAWLIDRSQLFIYVEERTLWLVRLALFVGSGYIGMVLAMRSNKEDFTLLIPYVRLAPQSKPVTLLLLDTSVIVDGRVADLIEANFLEGIIVVPRFVLRELQQIADSNDPIRRARGRRGLEMLSRLQNDAHHEVKVHEAEVPEEATVDGKLVRLAHSLGAKLLTNDYNLGKIAELQSVAYININDLASRLKPVILPGEVLNLRIVREGREKDQGVGFLADGTMVVVNRAQNLIGQQLDAQVISLLQTAAGTIVFADVRHSPAD